MTSGTETNTVPGETQQSAQDIKGRFVTFSFYMKKQGYQPETIRTNNGCLKALQERNADLLNPESVKEALSKEEKWSENRRRNVINAYSLFLKVNGGTWEKPRCNVVRKIPFIPTEQEIDCLIAGCPMKIATFLMLLKETAMRSGEAIRLQWKDVDLERQLITLNTPEKNSLPRQWNNPSQKLCDMLNALPRNDVRVFGTSTMYSLKATFSRSRRKLAFKLQDPRLLQIHFHTLRHWKATMEYHKTKDLLHVMAFLGHKKSDNTLLYVQLDKNLFRNSDDHFIIKTAHNVEEAEELGEIGFEPFDIIDGMHLYRKRK
jgi:integrase